MKWKGRRQSTNVTHATKKDYALADQISKVNRERTLSSEPIAYNRDAPMKEFLETQQGEHNPAKSQKARTRKVDCNPPDFKHFKHTTKGK